jgi:restriction endonuclease S subunit
VLCPQGRHEQGAASANSVDGIGQVFTVCGQYFFGVNMKKVLILALASVIAVTACKKSVSGQTSQWMNNLKELAEVSAKYPNLKQLLEAKATEAKAIFAEAEKINDEELNSQVRELILLSGRADRVLKLV